MDMIQFIQLVSAGGSPAVMAVGIYFLWRETLRERERSEHRALEERDRTEKRESEITNRLQKNEDYIRDTFSVILAANTQALREHSRVIEALPCNNGNVVHGRLEEVDR